MACQPAVSPPPRPGYRVTRHWENVQHPALHNALWWRQNVQKMPGYFLNKMTISKSEEKAKVDKNQPFKERQFEGWPEARSAFIYRCPLAVPGTNQHFAISLNIAGPFSWACLGPHTHIQCGQRACQMCARRCPQNLVYYCRTSNFLFQALSSAN